MVISKIFHGYAGPTAIIGAFCRVYLKATLKNMFQLINDMMNKDIDLQAALGLVEAWARECGEIQLGYFRSDRLHSRLKLNEADIVTEADGLSEKVIVGHIAQEFPGHSILGEESGVHEGSAEWRWVVDPLDGTTNFKAGLPVFTVSIALEHRGQTVLGVVFAPYLNEMFTAVKGCGARLNGRRIHCSATDNLACAVVCTGFPVDKGTNPDNNHDNFSRVMPRVRGIRRYGSAALDICYAGAGFFDAFWELHLHRWDISAAMLIAAEAGAVTEILRTTSELDISVFVSTPSLAPTLRPLLE